MRSIECLRSVTSNTLTFVPEFEQRIYLKSSRGKSGSRASNYPYAIVAFIIRYLTEHFVMPNNLINVTVTLQMCKLDFILGVMEWIYFLIKKNHAEGTWHL